MEFTQQFRAALRVSTPLVAIRTFDAKSTVGTIRTTFTGMLSDAPLLLWDAVRGLAALSSYGNEEIGTILAGVQQEATVQLPETLRLAENASKDVILFIANAHLQWGDPAVIQGIWNLRNNYKANGNMLVLLCQPGAILPPELANDVLVLDEPLPTAAELETIVCDTFKDAGLAAPDSETLRKATDALIGLPAFPADQATAMCLNAKEDKVTKERTGSLDITDLWERKRQIVSQTQGLSMWQGKERVEDIGGLASVKAFCKRIIHGHDAPKTIIFIDEIEKAFAGTGTDMSGVKTELTGSMLSWSEDKEIDGMIFIGLPGVSKSNLAKALGGTYGIPVINFDLAGMQSGLVGSSGANLRAAQKTVDAISGGRILMIATCNSIGALPPELRRRFNLGIFFFDAPTAEERASIWSIYRMKYAVPSSDPTPDDTGWTGAEIKECCKKAYRLRMTLDEAAQYIVPVCKSSAEQIQALRQSCSGKYLSASNPGVYAYSEVQTPSVPVYIDGTTRKIREMN